MLHKEKVVMSVKIQITIKHHTSHEYLCLGYSDYSKDIKDLLLRLPHFLFELEVHLHPPPSSSQLRTAIPSFLRILRFKTLGKLAVSFCRRNSHQIRFREVRA